MNEGLIVALVLSLVLTLFFEVGFFLLAGELLTGMLISKKRCKKDLVLVVMVNIITNPVVVLTFWIVSFYTEWNMIIVTIILEAMAVLTEGYYYKTYGQAFCRPYVFSIAANTFSYSIGFVLQRVIFH